MVARPILRAPIPTMEKVNHVDQTGTALQSAEAISEPKIMISEGGFTFELDCEVAPCTQTCIC